MNETCNTARRCRRGGLVLILALGFLGTSLSAGEPIGELTRFAESRIWVDGSGNFRVQAELKSADTSTVELRKPDGNVIKVSLDKLSGQDQKFVNEFLAAEKAGGASADSPENPFAGGTPGPSAMENPFQEAASPFTTTAPPSTNTSGGIRRVRPVVAGVKILSANPRGAFWEVKPPIALPQLSLEGMILQSTLQKPFFAKMNVLVAGRSPTILVNAYQQGRKPEENYSRFTLVNGTDGSTSAVRELSEPWKPLAITPNGATFAAVRISGWEKGNDLAIFKIIGDEIQPVFEFTATDPNSGAISWAAFLPNNRLATITEKHILTFWDLGNSIGPKALYRGPTGTAQEAEVSPAGELMILSVGTNIAVIETTAGKMVGYILRDEEVKQLALSPDGQFLAAFHPFTITIYSMQDGSEIKTIPVPASTSQTRLEWAGEHLMVGSTLYDVARAIPLWTYDGTPSAQVIYGGLLISAFGKESETTVSVLPVPHPGAMEIAAEVDPKTIYALAPGGKIRVTLDPGEVAADIRQQIEAGIQEKLEQQGWTYDPESEIVMDVSLKRGERQEQDYYSRRGFGPFAPPPGFGTPTGPPEKVSFEPWIHSVVIRTGQTNLYSGGYTVSAPQSLRIDEGQSAQSLVDQHIKPNPKFLQSISIPPYILKPEYQNGMGKSTISAAGLQ